MTRLAGGAGLIFTPCCEPYLSSEYGPDYVSESPVKLLDALMHGVKKSQAEEIVVLSQVGPYRRRVKALSYVG